MTTVKAHIQFFVDFVKTDGVDVLVANPEPAQGFVTGLVQTLNTTALAQASETDAFHPELELEYLQPRKDDVIGAIQAAIRSYNDAATTGGVRFQSDLNVLQKASRAVTGGSTQDSGAGEPSCIQIVFKHDEEGNLIRCIEYNFVLHPLDSGASGYTAYPMGVMPVSSGKGEPEQVEVQGKYQARLVYDVTDLTA